MLNKKIEDFLSGSGYGYGNGSGHGSGNGHGSGHGSGSGSGSGSTCGSGSGYGYGFGCGSEYKSGCGDGYGYGFGYGNGYGFIIQTFGKQKIYYIDNIPCIIHSIHNNIAKVSIIDIDFFKLTNMYIYKYKNIYAHGLTIQYAKKEAELKFISLQDTQYKIDLFHKTFKNSQKYPFDEFYKWHTTLTGSCSTGKDYFISQNKISKIKKYTVKEFIEITKNAYGGEIIKQLLKT